jgi:hypothetical protein
MSKQVIDMKISKTETQQTSLAESGDTELVSRRRRFVRAGLAAAPVLLTLKSANVLATGSGHVCVKPSAFSSLAAAGNNRTNLRVSNHTFSADEYTCYSHGYWKTHGHPRPYDDESRSYFRIGSAVGKVYAGFDVASGHSLYSKTLLEVLNASGGGEIALARHLVGCFLTAVKKSDLDVVLTQQQCRDMWASRWHGWVTPYGETWDLNKMLDYFEFLFGSSN